MCDISDKYILILDAIGALSLLFIVKKLWQVLYVFIFGPLFNQVDFKSYGEWALVTGSTDGIGKEYARQLAEKGCNIILVSRSVDKLNAVAEEIESEFKVKTKVVQCDFTNDTNDIYGHIYGEIQGLEIGVLVNNVGASYDYPEYFIEVPNWLNKMDTLIRVNCHSVIRMTGIVLPAMLKRGKGIIINIGSGTSQIPSPLLTVYASSKAFVYKFSSSLAQEYNKSGIIVQCITPGYVKTNMSAIKNTSFSVPSTKDYVKSTLSLVNTTSLTDGYFSHSLMTYIINNVLGAISESFIANIIKQKMENTRNAKKRKMMKEQ